MGGDEPLGRVSRRKRKIVDAETFYGSEFPHVYHPEGDKK